jgi:hypothetical protein
MKKLTSLLSVIIVLAVALTSCKGNGGVFTPTSSGRAYEILVVVKPDVWKAPAGKALENVLKSDVPGLPQSESSFKVMYVSPDGFDSTLKLIRNIIIVDIQDIYTKGSFKLAKDVYSYPQSILTIQAPDEVTLQQFVQENEAQIIDLFNKAEMNRQMAILEKAHSDYISTKVDSIFGSEVWVPAELASFKLGKDFIWASTNTATANRNFVMYSYPYTDRNTFTKEYFVAMRDSVMKANIPGAKPTMFMATDSMTVEVKPIEVQGQFAFEARGLWRMKGDFMGGPFVSHSRVDTVNNRVVTAEIFVYSPDKMKRNLVRTMEASLYTLKLPAAKINEQE